MSRYEVRGLDADKELMRGLARRLAEGDAKSAQLRAELAQRTAGELPSRGRILAALRRSPLIGSGLKIKRSVTRGRPARL